MILQVAALIFTIVVPVTSWTHAPISNGRLAGGAMEAAKIALPVGLTTEERKWRMPQASQVRGSELSSCDPYPSHERMLAHIEMKEKLSQLSESSPLDPCHVFDKAWRQPRKESSVDTINDQTKLMPDALAASDRMWRFPNEEKEGPIEDNDCVFER